MVEEATKAAASAINTSSHTGTGASKWTFSGNGAMQATPALLGSTIFAATENGNVYAINTANGTPIASVFFTEQKYAAIRSSRENRNARHARYTRTDIPTNNADTPSAEQHATKKCDVPSKR